MVAVKSGLFKKVGNWNISLTVKGEVFAFNTAPRGNWTAKHTDPVKIQSFSSLPQKVKDAMCEALLHWQNV